MWFPETESIQHVAVRWWQTGTGPGFKVTSRGRATNTIGTWMQKPGLHVLTFYPAGAASEQHSGKFVLKIDSHALTLDVKGRTRWTHTFFEGQIQASTMHEGGKVIPLVTECKDLDAYVDADVGDVYLQLVLMDGDDKYPITFNVQFGRVDKLKERN
ncbi:hypothetical protein JI721_14370 [Alicyclobacillus cycloheptanicus]|jgi:uncharacterized beta-barrel protein YwiB (DUF1934 family)|uniref:Uncharacterized beta-barrel protein YwiB (DUF1934 family) n=1 Tax=Alicyclobacillus cycloheptanicus TaxID=1457 RepID=A0ABT9XL77_9BACL|nr:hypothetical protein [Alicyclobacillus cycloheptanicus]MDQ0191061.1 uncharacterized beta-barrel protein YwiB (DUF1934 family) [Alicyclobacillus cycloheptanicus]WDM00857.1 hypothetical protein JI721_14370 [Alicyclobacillus cycloheptanicus]